MGLGAKLHCLNETSYPYQGDKEKQRINITSATVREKIVSRLFTNVKLDGSWIIGSVLLIMMIVSCGIQ